MLIKRTNGASGGSRMSRMLSGVAVATMDRRTFFRRSGIVAGGLAAASTLGSGTVTKTKAATIAADYKQIKTVCTHCSVGCTVIAEVQNGTWIGQEPGFDSPFNLGAHCAKGASVREHAHGERRLKYPTKMVGGKWTKIPWDQAIQEIGDKMLESARLQVRIPCTGWDRPSTATSSPIFCANSSRSGARTTATTRRASAIPPPSRAWPIPGATAR